MFKRRRMVETVIMAAVIAACSIAIPVYAVSEVTAKLNSLNELILSIVTVAGIAVLTWGVFDFATGYIGHDTSRQTMAYNKIAGGLIMVFAPKIIQMLQ